MPYSSHAERAYFTTDACAHCATRDEHLRLDHTRNQARALLGSRLYARVWR